MKTGMIKRHLRFLWITILLTSFWACTACGKLANQIDGIINRTSQKKVQFAIHIINADSGKTIYSHNPNRPMVPASNMKLITAAAALHFLGPEFRYKTIVGLQDEALVIVGSGDPLLGDKVTDAKYGRKPNRIFDDIIAALKKRNVSQIKDIIVDGTVFDDTRTHPSWPKSQLNRHYACQVSGLNFNSNCVEISAQNKDGQLAITLEPKTSYVNITNKAAVTSKPPSTLWCARKLGTNDLTLRGKCYKKAGPIYVAIERPAAFFGFLLAENLGRAGINVQGRFIEKQTSLSKDFKTISLYTTPIADVLSRCNKDSFGLAAEALLKTIAAKASPKKKNGSWELGRVAVTRYLADLGVSPDEVYIDDASGLSAKNKLSPAAITKVLFAVRKSKNWQLYKDSLAVGGQDGTIRRYFTEEKYKGKILGKTGYINKVKSFSGWCNPGKRDTQGTSYIFSILTHNANGKTREAINDIVKAVIDNDV
jgi:D-alanyl-D-alanine carboxypeptidase/D-alanyl-D-alanine-endopeptidase (penicillin-binding protein 4)